MSHAQHRYASMSPGKRARLLQWADRLQQSRPFLGVAVGTYKKFSDDQAGNLAALIAYYAFASIFPLLLVFVSVLNLVVRNNAKLRNQLLHSALSQYPGISKVLDVKNLSTGKTGFALVIGIVLTLYGARGIANAAQNALNTVWGVPPYRRPGFGWSLLRSFGLIAVIGPGIIITITLSGLAGNAGHLGGVGAHIAAVAVALVLNVGLFWLGFRMATSSEVRTRDLRLSAILAAIVWQILQFFGAYFLTHEGKSNSAYGIFGIVLGLLAWFYLQAQLTLYLVELNVVRVRRLWPRSLAPPPLTAADMQAYQLYAEASQHRPELEVEVHSRAGTADPGAPDAPQ
jgi:inner membrane protein YhjD